MYRHSKQYAQIGPPLNEAKKAIIMLHGRGASADSIITLADHLNLKDAAIFAPNATHQSWYPYSFLAPVEQNQPALDSALEVIGELVQEMEQAGLPMNKLFFTGFSQGACLALEYVARNAAPYGGVVAFTGGLIGQHLEESNYKGDFANMPLLITTGDPDPHVPLKRVEESVVILEKLNADVTLRVYKGRPHTIQEEEINLANQLIFL
jgi:phospholipase/carboxylesterase